MAVKVDIVKALRVTADNLKTNILAGYNSTTSNQLDVIYKDLSEGSKAGVTVQNGILKIVDAGSDRDIALGKITTPNVDRVEAHYRVQVNRYELGKAEVMIAGARIIDSNGNYTVGESTLTGQNVFIQTRTGLDTYTLATAQLDNEGWIDVHRLIVRTKDGFTDTLTVGQIESQYQFYIYPDGVAHEYTDELVEQMMDDWVDEHWMHVVTEALRMHVDFIQPDNTIAWGKVDTFIDLGQSYLVINETKYTFPGYTNAEFMTTPEYATIADVESRVQAILNVNQGPQGPQGNAGANGMTINYNNGKLIVGGEYSNSLYQGTGNATSIVLPNGSEIKFAVDSSEPEPEPAPPSILPVNPADTTPLFFEHYDTNKLIDACFVRSENQWNSGAIYVTAYNRLLRELADTTSEFKVIRLSDVGNTPDYQKYFIVDETEMRFKLPVVGSLGAPTAGNYLYYKLVNSVTDINMMNVAEISTALAHKMDNVNIVSTWMSEIASRPSGIDGKKIVYVTDYWHEGNSWYRVWSDGRIEQGGTLNIPAVNANWSGYQTINLRVPYSNATYARLIGDCGINAGANGTGIQFNNVTINSFQIRFYNSTAQHWAWMTWGY